MKLAALWCTLALLSGSLIACVEGPVTVPYSPPSTITAIFAVDRAGSLPDVALYDRFSDLAGQKAPEGYGAFRVEFDHTLEGFTVAGLPSLTDSALQTASACSPSHTITLVDVTANGAQVPASVCYDPSSRIGGGPSVLITPGTSGDPDHVFSCGTFAAAGVLAPSHTYALQFDTAAIRGSNGRPLQLPSNLGNGRIETSDLALLAAGRRDPATGFFHFLRKDSRGFLKDNHAEGGGYRQPARRDPVALFFSDALDLPAGTAAVVTRTADGSPVPVRVDNCSFNAVHGCDGDPRVLVVTPVGTWEPGVEYALTLDPSVGSKRSRARLGAVAPLIFKAGEAPLAVVESRPRARETAVPLDAPISLTLQAPVDPASVVTGSVTLAHGGTLVEADLIAPEAASNFQEISLVRPGL